jgi:DNA (cytosine-5)-methyltransferase 1
MNDVEVFLEKLYEESLSKRQDSDFLDVSSELKERLDHIIASSENSKGVLAVVATSLIYKALNPQQDIRCHQQSIPGGYSGRTFDSLHVTPFLRSKSFPNMAESGWLTRSLEHLIIQER